jgi:hypothetical protein
MHVATRDDVYREFGRASELAQLFETELGTALLALNGLKSKRYADPDPSASRQALEEIESRTLGATLKAMRRHIEVTGELEECFTAALEARNSLAHGFFLLHGMRIDSEAGCAVMLEHIRQLREPMERAYASANLLTHTLFSALKLLRDRHTH